MSYRTYVNAAERYDKALNKSLKMYPPPEGVTRPKPTSAWPKVNVELLQAYQDWLLAGGASRNCTYQIYIPMAGHALALNCRPHREIDLETDLEKAVCYIEARKMSPAWTKNCLRALNRFRNYLKLQRGHITLPKKEEFDTTPYVTGLPTWLVQHLDNQRILHQPNWRWARLRHALLLFWRTHTRVWHWLISAGHLQATDGPEAVQGLRRQQLYDYIDERLEVGMAASTINVEVRSFQSTLRFLQEHEIAVPQSILVMRGLKEKDRLPRFLADEEVRKLRDYFEKRVKTVTNLQKSRDVLLDRAIFYLMWQAGLRLGEVCDLDLEDFKRGQGQILVKAGKGTIERVVYLTQPVQNAVEGYLTRRGEGVKTHESALFLYRFKRVDLRMIGKRLNVAGKVCGVRVHPHKLRHTFATQLVNAGCPITTIQRLMGHRRITSTMVYARVHDKTVADDYFRAMAEIEGRVNGESPNLSREMTKEKLEELLSRLKKLAEEESQENLVEQIAVLERDLLDVLQRWPVE